MIIVQTMVKSYKTPNISNKGLYTTMIPLASMKEYEFEFNCEEVNVIVAKTLLVGNFKSKCINVVKGEPFEIYDEESDGQYKDSVEVTFDLIPKDKDVKVKAMAGDPFGKHINVPYPHFLLILILITQFKMNLSLRFWSQTKFSPYW